MSRQLLKGLAVLLVMLAVAIGLAGLGWVVFSQFLNHPQWSNTGELQDMLGRNVSPAPWFIATVLPFLTDSVSSPPEYDVTRTVVYPMAPGKYWLGWGWSILDWLGMVVAFGVAYGLGSAGYFLWERSSGKPMPMGRQR
ncbi:MAG: hypothetical protein KKB90_00075 [Actinobacteria bacterium]|nr:hypothetical protein [Actinomycetota bacterium]MCG2818825.1 hypothetical protein [Actinomycetes bacterium]MBU4217345.1 hypothetical protein [Actinomycetota bacterium]MBU4359502.1 hypothetical protein [Actinomycetota bacterium]MBU4392892.1 hypothetical protein [Actinomycetota bacterium]